VVWFDHHTVVLRTEALCVQRIGGIGSGTVIRRVQTQGEEAVAAAAALSQDMRRRGEIGALKSVFVYL